MSRPTAVVRVDASRAAGVERELGAARVVRRGADGSIDVEVPCANVPAFRSWVLGLLDHAEVVGPPDVRAASCVVELVSRAERWRAQRDERRPRRTAEERLSRLLVMLPWLMEQGEVPLADVARRFGMSEAEVARDLELAAMCGLPPFVDEMIDVFIDDDTVFVGVPRLFTRPLRLTAPGGLRARRRRPRRDAAARAPTRPARSGRGLDKLAAALGDDAVVVDLPIAPGSATTIEALRTAITTAASSADRVLDAVARRGDRRARSRRGACSTTAASGTSWPTTVAPVSAARSASTASSR